MMKIKVSIKRHWEENISLLIIVLGFIELQTEAIHEILKWPMIVLGILALTGCYIFHRVDKRISFVIISTIIVAIIEVLFSEGILATQYIWDIGICLPVALCMYYAKNVTPAKWKVLYIAVTIYLILKLISSPDSYTIFYSHSRNYISVFEIFLLFMMALVSYKNRIEVPQWMYYSTLATCIIAVGRGGILAAFILFTLYILHSIYKEKKQGNKVIKLVIVLVGALALLTIFVTFQDTIIIKFFPRFAKTGLESESSSIATNKRLMMWWTYITQSFGNTKQFLLGTNPIPIVKRIHYRLDFNIHNSYLMAHVFYGIFGIITVVVCFIRCLKSFFTEDGTELSIILLTFMFRALTDHCFPGKLSAIVMWITIIYGLTYRKKSRRKMYFRV